MGYARGLNRTDGVEVVEGARQVNLVRRQRSRTERWERKQRSVEAGRAVVLLVMSQRGPNRAEARQRKWCAARLVRR
jgi:hypothetical protein